MESVAAAEHIILQGATQAVTDAALPGKTSSPASLRKQAISGLTVLDKALSGPSLHSYEPVLIFVMHGFTLQVWMALRVQDSERPLLSKLPVVELAEKHFEAVKTVPKPV